MKKVRLFALLTALTLLLCSCGEAKPENESTLTAEQVVSVVLDKVSFSGEMTPQNAEYTALLYGIENSTDAASAAASGIVSETVTVFLFEDEAAANAAKDQLQVYWKDTVSEYEKYAPDEVVKLNKAILNTYGTALVYCVAPDYAEAGTVLGDIFSGVYNEADAKTTTTTTTTTVTTTTTTEITTTTTSETTAQSTTAIKDGAEQSASTTGTTTTVHTGPYPLIKEKGSYESYGAVVRSGNACYECYFYSDKLVTSYTDHINTFAKRVPETINVYNMVIPNSAAITLPDTLFKKIPSANQEEAIQKAYAKLNDRVITVPLYETLMNHRDEYIYFRTDHHWTARGAYYAYRQFCEISGRKAAKLKSYKTKSFKGFLGSFYAQSGESKSLKKKPDTVTVYYPLAGDDIQLKYRTTTTGEDKSWPIVKDVSDYKAGRKYNAFAAGDNPLTTVTNAAVTDGSVCIFVKDSYGNALVPFLADQYQTLYEVDFRYYENSLYDLVYQNPNADVIFANNISMLQSNTLQGKFSVFMSREPKLR